MLVHSLANLLYPPACLLCSARLTTPETRPAEWSPQGKPWAPQPSSLDSLRSSLDRLGTSPRHVGGDIPSEGPKALAGARVEGSVLSLESEGPAAPPAPQTGAAQTGLPTPHCGQAACAACERAMPDNGPPVCRRCGAEIPGAFDAVTMCASCRRHPPAFDQARAPWRYAGPTQEAVCQFKYRRRWRIGRWLAETMAQTARASFDLAAVDVVLPVPLHWLKQRLRGWNPSAALAETVARSLGKPCAGAALRRGRWTVTQTRLSGRRRIQNVEGAFAAEPRLVQNRTVLLLDDVLTSGATANACAQALKEAGARHVLVLTAARTPLSS